MATGDLSRRACSCLCHEESRRRSQKKKTIFIRVSRYFSALELRTSAFLSADQTILLAPGCSVFAMNAILLRRCVRPSSSRQLAVTPNLTWQHGWALLHWPLYPVSAKSKKAPATLLGSRAHNAKFFTFGRSAGSNAGQQRRVVLGSSLAPCGIVNSSSALLCTEKEKG